MKITIYIEGGGNTASLCSELRKSFSALFENVGLKGRLPKVVACGSRSDAYFDFKIAFEKKKADELILLLVDSEEIISLNQSKWQHLQEKVTNATEDNLFFMVTIMESWFLADIAGLESFFGKGFDAKKLPQNTNREEINKKDIYRGLEKATEKCSKGKYGKGQHSFKILSSLDAHKIKNHGEHSSVLFEYLEKMCNPP